MGYRPSRESFRDRLAMGLAPRNLPMPRNDYRSTDWDWGLIFGVSVVLLLCLGAGACIADWATSERVTHEVTITDKRHVPGHYRRDCDTDYIDVGEMSIPVTTCENVWVAPTWTLRYEDGSERFDTSVGQGLYDQVRLGDRVWVSFDQGGYFGWRFSESFLTKLPGVE